MERVARAWRWLAIAAVVVALAAVVASVWLHYPTSPSAGPLQGAIEPAEGEAAASGSTPSEPVADSPERAKLEELRAMSETFRNTTFLIAIRDSGYLCSDLVSVYGGIGDSIAWTVACREMLAYAVRVSHAGTLLVEPTLQYLDAPFPVPEGERPRLPPQPLR